MPQIILLGTGSAWSGPARENTYMLVRGKDTNILVDCAGSPAQRLARVGVNVAEIDQVILTHMHPDHIYGWPIFALDAWMAGRRAPMHVYALPETVRSARMMLRAVGSNEWPNFFRIQYHSIKTESIGLVFADHEFSVSVTQTDHFVPTIAVRITSEESGESVAYSCDTTPQDNIIELARGVKYLFHEATTLEKPSIGHSSAVQAGRQATRAGAEQLVLLHLPPETQSQSWLDAARQEFKGRVHVASDLQSFEF